MRRNCKALPSDDDRAPRKEILAPSYSPTTKGSTIGATGLNDSVRNEKRCGPRAISTRKMFDTTISLPETAQFKA